MIAKEEKRLDSYLVENISDITRSQIKKQIDSGNIRVNGEIVKGGHKLRQGDEIDVEIVYEETEIIAQDIPIDVVYENDNILVVNKAQGMVVHPAVGNRDGTLMNALLGRKTRLSDVNGEGRLGIVHRIDKNTSGLMVVAKNNLSHNCIAEQIKDKTCKRKYIALVRGRLKNDEGVIDKNLIRSKKNRLVYEVCSEYEGKNAVTLYKVIERFERYTLVEFELKTGRTHQIRAHCKYLNHTIVGDKEYGIEVKGLAGQLLHSCSLSLDEPSTKERLEFSAELPDYFKNYLTKIR